MTAVTFILPDELAKQAQAAGLLSEARLAELISGALKAHGADITLADQTPNQRRLIRQNDRLVVELLPGEKRISNEEVSNLLNKMEW